MALTEAQAAQLFALGRRFGLPKGTWRALTWGGLRGGITVALARWLPVGTTARHRAGVDLLRSGVLDP